MNGLNCLYQLALKDDVLNEIALKKDKKYGFTTQILNDDTFEACDNLSNFEYRSFYQT